ncbi:unnamed protein product, partial [marine sediment metagenome]
MDDWQIIGWFLLGLFTDNLLGMLYAWKLGPDRAEKLVINSLLNELVIKKIRKGWDFPTSAMVKEINGSVKDEISKLEATFNTAHNQLRRDVDSTTVSLSDGKVDDLTKGVVSRLKPSLT